MLAANERVIDAKLIVSIVSCGVLSFAGVVVETAMNVAFPILMSEFSVNTATVQWITTGYLLVLACIVPLSSFFKKRFRTKTLFMVAAILFFSGTVMCAAAPVFAFLILGRVIQGFGTGLALPLMFNIVIEQAPFDRMGMMMGVATLITATAPAVGPSVGGLIVSLYGWRMVFVTLMPFVVVAFIGGIWAIRQVSEIKRVKFSVVQFVLLAASFVCLVFATNSASEAGWLSAQVLGLMVAFVVLLALYCVAASRSDNPLVRVSIFRAAPFTLSVCYIFLIAAIVLGLGYLLPYYGQEALDLDEFSAGCLLLPGCIIGAILAPMGGRILDIFGAKRPIIIGSVILCIAMVCFMEFGFGEAAWVLALIYVLVPISQGFSMANSMTNGLKFLPEELKTDGNAGFNTIQQLGGAIGTAVATSLMNAAQAGDSANVVAGTIAGAHDIYAVLLGAALVGLACTAGVFITAKRPKEQLASGVQEG